MNPAEHARMLAELLRPAGADLARRWLAALLLVPRDDREAVVAAVERRVAAIYPLGPGVGASGAVEGEFTVVHPPEQRDGYVERVEVTYGRGEPRRGESRAEEPGTRRPKKSKRA